MQIFLEDPLRRATNARQPLADRGCRLFVPPSHDREGGQGVRSGREPTGILSSFDMKKPALAGYSHVEGEDLEDLCTATYPPRPLSRGKGGTDPKIDSPYQGENRRGRSAVSARLCNCESAS